MRSIDVLLAAMLALLVTKSAIRAS